MTTTTTTTTPRQISFEKNNRSKRKSMNPLYVVSNKGKDVEEAKSIIDLLGKKFNIEPAIEILNTIVTFLINNIKNHASIQLLQQILDGLIKILKYYSVTFQCLKKEILQETENIFNPFTFFAGNSAKNR